MRAALMMAFMFTLSSTADAQQSVLARRIKMDAPGAAVVWLPDGIANGMFAWRIAESAGVPLVFEPSPFDYRDPSIASHRLDLDGLTVRDALDVLVAQDPRYRWEERDGVIVIRPIDVIADPTDALNHRIAGVRGERRTLHDVLARVTEAVRSIGAAPAVPATADSRAFGLEAPGGTVLDLLSAAARAHGSVMWSAPGWVRGADQAGFGISFKTFAGGGRSDARAGR